MKNLTYEILKIKKYQKTWSEEKLKLIIKLWGQLDNSLNFDNDIESGEQWVKILKNNNVIAMIGVGIPMLILNNIVKKIT